MRIRSVLTILFLVIVVVSQLSAQSEKSIRRAAQGKSGASPDEIVSFNADVPYSKAVQALGELSKKFEGRLLIDRSPLKSKDKNIGINIESMYWKDAFELILRSNQLWYNDYPEYIEIVPFEEIGKQLDDQAQKEAKKEDTKTPASGQAATTAPVAPVVVDSSEYYSKVREVNISAVFFDINKTKLAESGISFSFFRQQGTNLQIQFSGAEKVTNKVFGASVNPTGLVVNIDAALNMFESEQLGEVISRPQLSVRSGSSSSIQVGQDFSVFEKDFSGNLVQKFYPAGTILNVRPKIYKIGEMEFIDVQYSIEKSTFEATEVSTVKNKTLASSSLILLNGEEGYVGGLYTNDELVVRQGIPLLKDLPWWVFGLRYLFGYDSKRVTKRELIVLIKAEILPTLEERMQNKQAGKNLIQDELKEIKKDFERRTGKKLN